MTKGIALKVKRIYAASIRGKAGKGVIDRMIMPIKRLKYAKKSGI